MHVANGSWFTVKLHTVNPLPVSRKRILLSVFLCELSKFQREQSQPVRYHPHAAPGYDPEEKDWRGVEPSLHTLCFDSEVAVFFLLLCILLWPKSVQTEGAKDSVPYVVSAASR